MSEKRYGDGADVGDILNSSWGYDQTNISWYRVERRTEKSVWLVELKGTVVEQTGFMQGRAMPSSDIQGRYKDPYFDENGELQQDWDYSPFRRKLSFSTWNDEPEPYVKLSSYEYARPWDGSAEWCSWYA